MDRSLQPPLLLVIRDQANTPLASSRIDRAPQRPPRYPAPSDFEGGHVETKRAGRAPNLGHFQHGQMIADIAHDRQTAETGDELAQKLEPLAGKVIPQVASPVVLPLGRAKLATKPLLTGSPAVVNTIGMTDVACAHQRNVRDLVFLSNATIFSNR